MFLMCEFDIPYQTDDLLTEDILADFSADMTEKSHYTTFTAVRLLKNDDASTSSVLTKIETESEQHLKEDLVEIGYLSKPTDSIEPYLRT